MKSDSEYINMLAELGLQVLKANGVSDKRLHTLEGVRRRFTATCVYDDPPTPEVAFDVGKPLRNRQSCFGLLENFAPTTGEEEIPGQGLPQELR